MVVSGTPGEGLRNLGSGLGVRGVGGRCVGLGAWYFGIET
jgi:hypothetical protein